MESDTYKTIQSISEGLYKAKGSKFLSFAHPINSIDGAKSILGAYQKKYYDARHICYAYLLVNGSFRANDDGEPSGTAGKPILGQLQSFGLSNVLLVVIRYFGGVLLGTGGLVTAYKTAAADALDKALIIEKTIDAVVLLSFEYPSLDAVLRVVRKYQAVVLSQQFNADCVMMLSIRKNDLLPLRKELEPIETVLFSVTEM